MYKICFLILLFVIYSFLGWCMEIVDTYYHEKKIVNRGFMIGPYCPIYGTGALLVIWRLSDYIDKPIGLFVTSMVLCSIIEYACSYIMEKLFNTRWWDYSDKKFNINGRICLETMIPFGIGCMLVIYIINPFLVRTLEILPEFLLITIAIIIIITILIDFSLSFNIIWKFRNVSKEVHKDNTETITEYVRKEILKKNKVLYNRLVKAFPKLEVLKRKHDKHFKKKDNKK